MAVSGNPTRGERRRLAGVEQRGPFHLQLGVAWRCGAWVARAAQHAANLHHLYDLHRRSHHHDGTGDDAAAFDELYRAFFNDDDDDPGR